MVGEIFKNAIDTLTDDDKALPQVEALLPHLMRGVAVHHSGLLPILKELVEILFQVSFRTLSFCNLEMLRELPARPWHRKIL